MRQRENDGVYKTTMMPITIMTRQGKRAAVRPSGLNRLTYDPQESAGKAHRPLYKTLAISPRSSLWGYRYSTSLTSRADIDNSSERKAIVNRFPQELANTRGSNAGLYLCW